MTPRLRLLLLLAVAAGLWIARDRLLPASDVVEADVKSARATQRAPQAKPFDPSTAEVCVTPAALPERGHFAAVGMGDPFTHPSPPHPSRRPWWPWRHRRRRPRRHHRRCACRIGWWAG